MATERTDPSRVLVLDDFLPNYDPDNTMGINSELLSRRSNYRPEGIIGDNSDVRNCPAFQVIADHIPRACSQLGLPPLKSIATRVYLVSEAGDPFDKNIHVDDTSGDVWGYTFSYHWLGRSGAGGTVFYSDMRGTEELHRVEFRPNRLVVFPGRYPHTGWAEPSQPNNSRRVILSTFVVLAG
jgi:hypothetical protein